MHAEIFPPERKMGHYFSTRSEYNLKLKENLALKNICEHPWLGWCGGLSAGQFDSPHQGTCLGCGPGTRCRRVRVNL